MSRKFLLPLTFSILWILVSACTPILPARHDRRPTDRETMIMDVSTQVWVETGLPEPGEACQRAREALIVAVVASDAEMLRHTGSYCAPGCTERRTERECPYGCAAGAMYYGAGGMPVIIGHIDFWPNVLPHEMGHFLSKCTMQTYDTYHQNEQIWHTYLQEVELRMGWTL